MTELHGKAESDVFSQEKLIEVQFLYLGRKNEKSDVAYNIHVSLDNFSKVTTPDINNSTSVTESKSSTESADLCTGNSMNISGSLPLFRAYYYSIIITYYLLYAHIMLLLLSNFHCAIIAANNHKYIPTP